MDAENPKQENCRSGEERCNIYLAGCTSNSESEIETTLFSWDRRSIIIFTNEGRLCMKQVMPWEWMLRVRWVEIRSGSGT